MSVSKFSPMLSRRQMLQGFSVFAASSVLSGCGGNLYRAVTNAGGSSLPTQPPTVSTPAVPANPQPVPAGSLISASLAISSMVMGSYGKAFVGLSYEKERLAMPLFTGKNSDLVGLFRLLGPSVLRIGGNSVDEYVWNPRGAGQTVGQVAPADVDALAAFLQASGWSCIYGINLGGSATGATNPQLASEEVAYVSKALGAALVGVEIGNECENYRDPGSYYQYDWTVEMFEALWMQYRDAIIAATPSVPLVGPAAGSNVAGWTLPWGESVTGKRFGSLTQHYYRGAGTATTATVDDLISLDETLVSELQMLRAGAESIGVPFRIAECNSYFDGGTANVSNAYASSLWAIDMIFNCALGGATGVNFQGGGTGTYTPIVDKDGVVVNAQPIFYGMLAASLAGTGSLLDAKLSAGSMNVTSYAVKTETGLSLVIVNKDATRSLDLSVALPVSMNNARLQTLTQLSAGASEPSLVATSGVTLQSASIDASGAFEPAEAYSVVVTGEQLRCYVPALSAVVLQVT